ncbi:MAG: helix-turn-helix transcriptional regulator [Lentisphaeria bacterium]|nr:helix-turn-helix transcriptional regulator [Lentisphaeria bacterium]
MKYYEELVFNTHGEVPRAGGISKQGTFKGYWGIQYNHAGTLLFSLGKEQPVIVEGPHAFISYPGEHFLYGSPPGKTRHHCFICFSGKIVRRFISGGLLVPQRKNPLIQVVHSERFYSVFCKLREMIQQPGGAMQPRAGWMLEDLLLQLQEQPGTQMKINAFCEHNLQTLRQEICNNPLENWDFEEEARKLSISYSHFRRLFKELTGCAPNHFLIEARLNLAEQLLQNDVLSIAEVAHKCGFPDEFYFSRLFKKHRMISPSALRSFNR